MNQRSVIRVLLAVGLTAYVGCYTQFATLESSALPEVVGGDISQGENRTDTVRVKEREVCQWQRDFFGRPVLRCYTSYYDDDWHYYYDSPWWYRHSSYFDRYDCRCHGRHSYYDSDCYSCNDYCYWYCRDYYRYDNSRSSSGSTWNGSGGGGGGGGASPAPRPRRSLDGRAPAPSGGSPRKSTSSSSASSTSGDGEKDASPEVSTPRSAPRRNLDRAPGKSGNQDSAPQKKKSVSPAGEQSAPKPAPEPVPADTGTSTPPRRRSPRGRSL